MSNSYKRIEAVRKTGEILKYLARQKDPVTAPAISQAVNLPTPTVMCHLSTLEEIGFAQSINDRWQLGLGLGLIRARIKANLEGERDRISRDLVELEEAEHGE
ncbi:MAG: helix-turn-helix domain-containing protein [Nitrospirae bacterium]|nr:helix-turn-helix domain-containing protein [Nitrospirota bacterium]